MKPVPDSQRPSRWLPGRSASGLDRVPAAAWWRPYAAVAAVGLALYFQALSFGLTYLDDQVLIADNLHFLRRWSSVIDAFRQGVFHVAHEGDTYYRPLFTVSLVVDAHLWGHSFGGFHLLSILAHLAASCLLLSLLRRLGSPERCALFFAVAFAVSPALTQNIVHVPTRDDTLMGMFVLASMNAFIVFLRGGGLAQGAWRAGARSRPEAERPGRPQEGSWRAGALHLACWALALFSKETAVVLAPVCLAYLILVERGERPWPRLGALSAGWLGVFLVWFFLRRAALPHPVSVGALQAAQSFWANLPGMVQLCGKIVFPFNLSGLPFMRDTAMGWGIASLGLVAVALMPSRPLEWKRAAFGAVWFVAFLAPSMVLQSTTMAGVVAEKRLYAPIVGFFLVLLETNFSRGLSSWSGWAPKVGALFLLVHGTVAFSYSRSYGDRISFWTRAAAASPSLPLARRNLGAMYFLEGDLNGAEKELLAAMALNPTEPMVHNNLGLVLLRRGRIEEAEKELLLELKYHPTYVNAMYNLGVLYMRQEKMKETEALWTKVLSLNPDHHDAYVSLAALYYSQGREKEAVSVLDRMRAGGMAVPDPLPAVRLNP